MPARGQPITSRRGIMETRGTDARDRLRASQESELDASRLQAHAAESMITTGLLGDILQRVADVPSPSGAATVCRGIIMEELCHELGIIRAGATYVADTRDSGCDTLDLGAGGIRLVAHLDEISYLINGIEDERGYMLIPYCYHLAVGRAPARLLRFAENGGHKVIATGVVETFLGSPFFQPREAVLTQPGDRVTLYSPVQIDAETQRVTGSLDNAAGAAACLVACAAMAAMDIRFSFIMTDDEEGPAGKGSQTMSRGASRVFRGLGEAPLTVAVDIHGLDDQDLRSTRDHSVPWGASLAEASSNGRGSVAPPHMFVAIRNDLLSMKRDGVAVQPNRNGHVPRSDDVVVMTHTNRVLVLGYPGSNRHFDNGLPTANVEDLASLARALFRLGLGCEQRRISLRWR